MGRLGCPQLRYLFGDLKGKNEKVPGTIKQIVQDTFKLSEKATEEKEKYEKQTAASKFSVNSVANT